MKQIIQNLKTGKTQIEDIPCPIVQNGHVGIKTSCSLISVGTERMLVEFGKANIFQKAKSQPEKVNQVIDKIKTDGLITTVEAVKNKLDTPLPLGYCNVGTVVNLAKDTSGLEVGDRVVSNGYHAEYVVVPKNLVAKIPDNVDDESASFAVVGAIALQGIRLIAPTLGETVVVSGLGLIGLMAVQLLRANGCRVIGLDYEPSRLQLAHRFGAEIISLKDCPDPANIIATLTQHIGVDAVLITASTDSHQPIHQAAQFCRKRGRIVLVGVVGMHLSRADFYEKELSFQVSCSYGPGRYDKVYEQKGIDYPLPYVRWTEQRNFTAVLGLMASGQINVQPLISHQFDIKDAERAYQCVSDENPLGIILRYPETSAPPASPHHLNLNIANSVSIHEHAIRLGVIGAGSYASSTLIPAFKKTRATLQSIASATGISAVHIGKKFGFVDATTDAKTLLVSNNIDALVVATRHHSHAQWVIDAIEHNKPIFVEKPLAINLDDLERIAKKVADSQAKGKSPIIMLGFNRRYSPYVKTIKTALENKKMPCSMIMTINAGNIPADHWVHDPETGGGRIVGEVCHFVDLMRFLAGSPVCSVNATYMPSSNNDTVSIQLGFESGSMGTIHYFSNGNKSVAKERIEVYCDGSIAIIDNFRKLTAYKWPMIENRRSLRQQKGQAECAMVFIEALKKGSLQDLIPMNELMEVARLCIDISKRSQQSFHHEYR